VRGSAAVTFLSTRGSIFQRFSLSVRVLAASGSRQGLPRQR
jgi:hypothetical protein